MLIDGITDYRPPRAVTDCVTLIAMPRLSSGQMKQGFVMSLLKSLFPEPDAGQLTSLVFVGSGSSAVVYDASRCDQAFLSELFRMLTSPMVKTLRVHDPVVLKFTVITSIRSYEDAVRENTVHRYLSTVSTDIKGHIISVKDQVPLFFWSGYLSGWYITAMQYVRSESLQQRLATGPLSVHEYADVQRMFYHMWCLGVAHADAHLRNIVYRPGLARENYMMLDFGNALFLPHAYVKRLRDTYHPRSDAVAVWFVQLSLYVRTIVGSRGLRGFQPDGLLLNTLKHPRELDKLS